MIWKVKTNEYLCLVPQVWKMKLSKGFVTKKKQTKTGSHKRTWPVRILNEINEYLWCVVMLEKSWMPKCIFTVNSDL